MPPHGHDRNEPLKANGPWGAGGGNGSGGGGGSNGGGGGRPPKSPWGGGGGGGNGPNRPPRRDDDPMRAWQERLRQRRGAGGGGRGGGGDLDINIGPGAIIGIVLAGLIAWLATGIVVVEEGERAAVFRFGEYKKNYGPGLHLHLPSPIEAHEILPSQEQQETSIGLNESESLMLTGDENIVDLRFRVFWFYDQENPENFILNVEEGEELVKAAAESVMREVIGKSQLNAVITEGRGEIQQQVRSDLQDLLNDYRGGVEIQNVEILEAQVPPAVRNAFIDVINAGQDAERVVEEAQRTANDIVPRARGTAQETLQSAEAYRERVIADATGEASRFSQILTEYLRAPQVTRERMYLETMERVLEKSDKTVLDNESGALPYLPLDGNGRAPTR